MIRKVRYTLRQAKWVVVFMIGFVSSVQADDYADQWGPPVGSAMPTLSAADQAGTTRVLADLAGDQGLLLFLNRSADW
ncbi:MAG: hypothetical protein GXP16_13560 [Gammaproteobacteria bacterium]|nr:hypothetical protein [Gammaproteobacteria bacterium]